MPVLPVLAQIGGQVPSDWWWQTLTSQYAIVLLAVMGACLLLLLFLGLRLRKVTAEQRAQQNVRERLSDDSGVAMIEFVLVTPILLFLSLMLIQTMLVFTGLFYVQYSAYAAARSAIVQIPLALDEPTNTIMPVRGSTKFDSIESAAILALVPVSGRESGSSPYASEMVSGLNEVFAGQGKSVPAWVDGMLSERLAYAINHTEVELSRVRPGEGSTEVEFEQAAGLTQFSPKEAVGVKVRHEFALSIPLASRVFALVGKSGSYAPASVNPDNPAPPGQWTEIESRAILTNEGIQRTLPEQPSVPRL